MPKEGTKFRVLSNKKSLKKKRFKGVPKWEIEAQKRTPQDSITFVDESRVQRVRFTDASTQTLVFEEQTTEPVIPRVSASERKINQPKRAEKESYPLNTARGYRILSMESLEEFVARLHGADGCSGECLAANPNID